jgi:two-component system OmpR family sensor kinase
MQVKSIGAKLTMWYAGLLTLTFIVVGGIAYGMMTYSLAQDMDYALNGVAKVLAKRAHEASNPFFPRDIDQLFRRFFGSTFLERQVDIFDSLGRRRSRRPGPSTGKLPLSKNALRNATQGKPTFETIESSGSYPIRLLTVPVIKAGQVTDLVRVGMSLKNMHQTLNRFLLIMAAVLPLALLLASVGGWLLAKRALKPVDHMTRTARRISAESLDQRIAQSDSGDEMDRLAGTINDMLDRLDISIKQMRQFSADASHELQTPLTILKGEMEVALRSPRSPAEYQHVLQSGLEEIDRLNRLVEGLLLLARADAGVLRLDFAPVELETLLQEVAGQMNSLAQAKGIVMDSANLRPVKVRGDQEHLRRLLINLLDNALKYTPPGGEVSLSLTKDKGWARLEVADTGLGISQAEQELIFSRFHRAADTRTHDQRGVGLGLNIADSIVKAHGGTLTLQSKPGKGSTFCVELPIDPA